MYVRSRVAYNVIFKLGDNVFVDNIDFELVELKLFYFALRCMYCQQKIIR